MLLVFDSSTTKHNSIFQAFTRIPHISYIINQQINFSINFTMSQRKVWKQEEDQILKKLYEQSGIKKWSEVSRMMETLYGMEGRNGKQCRERYHNHLKVGIKKEKWSKEEETLLVKLHAQHGNRWALISKLIPGRTQNCVKNMLYSKLRKSVRQLNRFSYSYYRKIFKQIKINFIYKLIEFTEHAYKKEESERNQQEQTGLKLKKAILHIDYDDNQELNEEDKLNIKALIEEIIVFKRNNQRFRGFHSPKLDKSKTSKKSNDQKKQESEILDQSEERKHELYMSNEEEEDKVSSLMQEQNKQANLTFIGEQLNKIQQAECSDAMAGLSQFATMESISISKERSKVSVFTMDNLDNNISLLLVDSGLQYPIQVQNNFLNLTPTPQHPNPIYEDWATAFSSWKQHIND